MSAAAPGFGRYRWRICGLLFFATTINYMDRQVLGLLAPTLQKDIGWSETQYAHIIVAFQAAYTIGLLVFGRWIDAIGTRKGYAVAVAFWSVAAAAHARGGGGAPGRRGRSARGHGAKDSIAPRRRGAGRHLVRSPRHAVRAGAAKPERRQAATTSRPAA